MKNLFFLTLILLLLTACSKKSPIVGGDVGDNRSMQVSYIDSDSLDLLNNTVPNAFNKDVFRLYHMKDGVKTLYNAGANMDNTSGIRYSCSRPLCFISIVLSDTVYLELSDQVTDTIYCKITDSGMFSVKKIWYNGNKIWDINNWEHTYFIIER